MPFLIAPIGDSLNLPFSHSGRSLSVRVRPAAADYAFEPSPEALLATLVPRQVNFQVWRALLESNAGFFAAQMTSMDNATKNAGDMIEELTREMNKERQSSITLELMDIIGGAEAVG